MASESTGHLIRSLPAPWREGLGPATQSPSFAALEHFLDEERGAGEVFPPADQVFAALCVPPAAVRVVILGQDPYHGAGQAHGLAFSVRAGVPHPPSLRNIFKERQSDIGLAPPKHGELSAWAQQGVLLLNTVLTVRQAQAHSHRKRGWEAFTDAVFDLLCAGEPRVFVLWGKPAQKKRPKIDERHTVLEAPHPSPLSAYRGFFGSAPFSGANAALQRLGRPPIDWRVDEERTKRA